MNLNIGSRTGKLGSKYDDLLDYCSETASSLSEKIESLGYNCSETASSLSERMGSAGYNFSEALYVLWNGSESVRMPSLPHYVKMTTHGRVRSKDEKIARTAATFMDGYAQLAGMPEPEKGAEFYLSRDIEETCREVYKDWPEKELERMKQRLNSLEGLSTRDSFFVNVSKTKSSQYLIETVAHEMSHCLRTRLRTDDSKIQDPLWLDEGISEYHSLRVVSEISSLSYEQNRENYLKMLGPMDPVRFLKSVETTPGFLSEDYALSFFAAELLAFRSGEKALFDFYSGLRPGASVEEEFRNAFGISRSYFQGLFYDHKSEGFPELDFPKNNFS